MRPISGIDSFETKRNKRGWFDIVSMRIINNLISNNNLISFIRIIVAGAEWPRAFCGIPRQLFGANDREARETGP